MTSPLPTPQLYTPVSALEGKLKTEMPDSRKLMSGVVGLSRLGHLFLYGVHGTIDKVTFEVENDR
jgi:hypothetical protein